jgi:hypothetical protein
VKVKQIIVAIAAIVCAILLFALSAHAAKDTPIPDLTGAWNIDLTYQGYDTSGVLTLVLTDATKRTYNVTGQFHTFIGGDIAGDICDESVSGNLVLEPDHVVVDSHGTNYVTYGNAKLFTVPNAHGCPATRAPFLYLAFHGVVGDDCDSVVEATAPPFVCNEHMWVNGAGSYAQQTGVATQYPVVGSLLYPDLEVAVGVLAGLTPYEVQTYVSQGFSLNNPRYIVYLTSIGVTNADKFRAYAATIIAASSGTSIAPSDGSPGLTGFGNGETTAPAGPPATVGGGY